MMLTSKQAVWLIGISLAVDALLVLSYYVHC